MAEIHSIERKPATGRGAARRTRTAWGSRSSESAAVAEKGRALYPAAEIAWRAGTARHDGPYWTERLDRALFELPLRSADYRKNIR